MRINVNRPNQSKRIKCAVSVYIDIYHIVYIIYGVVHIECFYCSRFFSCFCFWWELIMEAIHLFPIFKTNNTWSTPVIDFFLPKVIVWFAWCWYFTLDGIWLLSVLNSTFMLVVDNFYNLLPPSQFWHFCNIFLSICRCEVHTRYLNQVTFYVHN